jgi:colanic acid/amylovoran biosynthesis protein
VRKSPRILISHVYSAHNKGDAAILSVLINDLRKEFEKPAITVLTLDSIHDGETFDGAPVTNSFMFYAMKRFKSNYLTFLNALYVMTASLIWAYCFKVIGKSFPVGRNLKDLCALYADADLIIPVGGGYLRSQKSGIGSLLNVALLLHPLKLAGILGKRTTMYTQSVGPFANALEELMVKSVLNECVDAIALRENTSLDLLTRLKVSSSMYRAVDAGFAFTSAGRKYSLRKKLGIADDQLLIGITARKWLRGQAQMQYETAVAQVVRHLVDKHHAAVVFLPQVTAEYLEDDDRIVHERIMHAIGDLDGVYSIKHELNHHTLKAAYESLDLVIGTRFHSVIFALTSYVPAIAIEYEHKTGGIMKDLGLDKWVLKMENVDADNLCGLSDDLISERLEYKRKLKRILPAYLSQTSSAIKVVLPQFSRFSDSANGHIVDGNPAVGLPN